MTLAAGFPITVTVVTKFILNNQALVFLLLKSHHLLAHFIFAHRRLFQTFGDPWILQTDAMVVRSLFSWPDTFWLRVIHRLPMLSRFVSDRNYSPPTLSCGSDWYLSTTGFPSRQYQIHVCLIPSWIYLEALMHAGITFHRSLPIRSWQLAGTNRGRASLGFTRGLSPLDMVPSYVQGSRDERPYIPCI
jgi:hypothetical protein